MKNSLQSLSDENLQRLVSQAEELFENGTCCPLKCKGGANRPCGAVENGIKVASFAVHDGEEPPVSGWNGAGNVFFSGCPAKCIFCQNWPISHENNGKIYTLEEFRENILKLLKKKVHNINFVTGDQYLGKVLMSLVDIKDKITIPIVYNCNGAHTAELFKIIMAVSDIFLFDIKYSSDDLSKEFSKIRQYVKYNLKCLDMLLEKNIPWIEDELGILKSGLIIRHLVLPGYLDNSIGVIELLNEYKMKGLNFKLSLMSQYFPAYKAFEKETLSRKITVKEYAVITNLVEKYELEGWVQDLSS